MGRVLRVPRPREPSGASACPRGISRRDAGGRGRRLWAVRGLGDRVGGGSRRRSGLRGPGRQRGWPRASTTARAAGSAGPCRAVGAGCSSAAGASSAGGRSSWGGGELGPREERRQRRPSPPRSGYRPRSGRLWNGGCRCKNASVEPSKMLWVMKRPQPLTPPPLPSRAPFFFLGHLTSTFARISPGMCTVTQHNDGIYDTVASRSTSKRERHGTRRMANPGCTSSLPCTPFRSRADRCGAVRRRIDANEAEPAKKNALPCKR